MAKAALWLISDAHVRERGKQTGLDTLVVHAVNDECSLSEMFTSSVAKLTH